MLCVTEDNYILLKKNTELQLTNPRVKFVLEIFYHITPGMYGRRLKRYQR